MHEQKITDADRLDEIGRLLALGTMRLLRTKSRKSKEGLSNSLYHHDGNGGLISPKDLIAERNQNNGKHF